MITHYEAHSFSREVMHLDLWEELDGPNMVKCGKKFQNQR